MRQSTQPTERLRLKRCWQSGKQKSPFCRWKMATSTTTSSSSSIMRLRFRGTSTSQVRICVCVCARARVCARISICCVLICRKVRTCVRACVMLAISALRSVRRVLPEFCYFPLCSVCMLQCLMIVYAQANLFLHAHISLDCIFIDWVMLHRVAGLAHTRGSTHQLFDRHVCTRM